MHGNFFDRFDHVIHYSECWVTLGKGDRCRGKSTIEGNFGVKGYQLQNIYTSQTVNGSGQLERRLTTLESQPPNFSGLLSWHPIAVNMSLVLIQLICALFSVAHNVYHASESLSLT
jgi:hypothetical protein